MYALNLECIVIIDLSISDFWSLLTPAFMIYIIMLLHKTDCLWIRVMSPPCSGADVITWASPELVIMDALFWSYFKSNHLLCKLRDCLDIFFWCYFRRQCYQNKWQIFLKKTVTCFTININCSTTWSYMMSMNYLFF